jgi:hypothetical protein
VGGRIRWRIRSREHTRLGATRGVAPQRAENAGRSHTPPKKLEERAEEIVDAYLRAGVDQGDWRALDALVNRVYGKPKETIATEQAQGSNVSRFLDQLSMEELEALARRGRLEALREEEIAEQLRRFSPEDRRAWLRRLNDQAAAQENDEEAASG